MAGPKGTFWGHLIFPLAFFSFSPFLFFFSSISHRIFISPHPNLQFSLLPNPGSLSLEKVWSNNTVPDKYSCVLVRLQGLAKNTTFSFVSPSLHYFLLSSILFSKQPVVYPGIFWGEASGICMGFGAPLCTWCNNGKLIIYAPGFLSKDSLCIQNSIWFIIICLLYIVSYKVYYRVSQSLWKAGSHQESKM